MAVLPGSMFERFIIRPASKFALLHRDPTDTSAFAGKEDAQRLLAENADAINHLQDRLYGEKRRALLIVLQGVDTSGKDGTIRNVFRTASPLGTKVVSFTAPTAEERAHDFLWRVHKECPEYGWLGVFNRSHYEDVLVAKVRGLAHPDVIERRYEQINAFERMLVQNGTTILKFFLHLSKEEQRKRLLARLSDPRKHWKLSSDDLDDRGRWDAFNEAYELAIKRCSTDAAPWFVVPADRKWARDAAIAAVIRETLEHLDPKYPSTSFSQSEMERFASAL